MFEDAFELNKSIRLFVERYLNLPLIVVLKFKVGAKAWEPPWNREDTFLAFLP